MKTLIKKAKSVLKKYGNFNKLHKNKEFKTDISRESNIERLLEKEIKKYPIMEPPLFNSLLSFHSYHLFL